MAKANTITPANLVSVIPVRTLLPVIFRDSLARDFAVPEYLVYDLTICETNSTPIPTDCIIIGIFICMAKTRMANKTYHNQVNKRYSIKCDTPCPHQTTHIN